MLYTYVIRRCSDKNTTSIPGLEVKKKKWVIRSGGDDIYIYVDTKQNKKISHKTHIAVVHRVHALQISNGFFLFSFFSFFAVSFMACGGHVIRWNRNKRTKKLATKKHIRKKK